MVVKRERDERSTAEQKAAVAEQGYRNILCCSRERDILVHDIRNHLIVLEGILRKEWGFEGCVTTDWWTCGEHYKEVKAGNDVKMGCGYPERLLEAIEKGCLTRGEMEACAERILNLILKID